jgi:tRNA 2-thiouridine synthesizing protein A
MKTVEVNAKGLACPQPVVLSMKALAEMESGKVIVSVDNEVARDNVKRMAEHEGCTVTVEGKGDGFELQITRVPPAKFSTELITDKKVVGETLVYLFESDFIGRNRELGKILINGFLNAITSLPKRKSKIVLISNGVRLATAGSYVLDTLLELKQSGFEILICGTCLDFFKIRDKVQAGTISNALEIMGALTNASKVVKF